MEMIRNYLRKSLARRFGVMMGGFLLFFLVGTGILLLILNEISDSYTEERTTLKKKALTAQKISEAYNEAFFDARGYFAFGNDNMRDSTIEKEEVIRRLSDDFGQKASSEKDLVFLQEVDSFSDYYFGEVTTRLFSAFENGVKGPELAKANPEVTKRVKDFRSFLSSYLAGLEDELDDRYSKLIRKQTIVTLTFILFIIGILLTVLVLIRLMLRQVGKPLSELSAAANDIADGKTAYLPKAENREDEIGVLSLAFRIMAENVLEKEQDLLKQNTTLIDQKEELHAQQEELEKTLLELKNNERKLGSRNELINRMSSSLNKQEVLGSVISNMRRILRADKGIIVLLSDESFAAEGVSSEGSRNFIEHLKEGMVGRIVAEQGPILIERRTQSGEEGLHDESFFCQDLYIPVFTAERDIAAVMCFTRLGKPFVQEDYEDWLILSKNIGIAVDKISIFELSEKERKLNQSILDSIKEGVQLVNQEGTILQLNRKFCEMFGLNDGHPIGIGREQWTTMLDSFIDENDEFLVYLTEAFLGEENGESHTFTYTKKDTGQVIKVYSEAVCHAGKRLGTVFVHRDITKEFEVDQMKSEFVSTVSHELRTPLASILGFSELMLNRNLKPERQKKYTTTILSEAKRLTSLINDFLDVQKMEAGKMEYDKKPINLNEVVQQVVDLYKDTTTKHEIHFVVADSPATMIGDEEKIGQVFRNLLSNAIKYSPEGGTITITVFGDNGNLNVEVSDPGIGIPEEAMGKLFSKFYRVDNSDLRKIGGTGLGLAIVQEIIKEHGGDIKVSSVPDLGSTFTVTFPAYLKKIEEKADIEEGNGSGYRVMVVEDDSSLRELIVQELRENGFRVTYFSNGEAALEAMAKRPPDALVLDIVLGGGELDGWEIMNRMKKSKDLKNLPIIISSALDEKIRGLGLGAQDYLVKPYKPSQLSKTIMQTLLNLGKSGQIFVPGQGDNF
ncbi:ATP-binding protein [Bacillus sp. FJAT-27245]|uniref:ATP-binding protein n=1 Tax=Bacillus sp. FJAT-27245 TaxID=1684144 RepID=UPI0006A7AF50|nr:ATP-binding protein [Bacillus sp. FJAT-27245]